MNRVERSRLRVAIVVPSFTPHMGYLGNVLPRYLARLGVDTHLVTLDLPHNYYIASFDRTYRGLVAADGFEPGVVREFEGYTVHVLPHAFALGQARMPGLRAKLTALRPDVVQVFSPIGWLALECAVWRDAVGYRLFTGNHTTASVFPLAQRRSHALTPARLACLVTRSAPGRYIATKTEICHAATGDCAEVANRFFGVPAAKIEVHPLGVDTDIFRPISSDADAEARRALRAACGFAEDEIVCVYSGRMSADKNPLLLARAVGLLRAREYRVRGLFIGSGVQSEQIADAPGCVVRPFVPVQELGDWFRAADIGVWPTQESTSMLDAAACGVPVIVNDTLRAVERIRGNGLQYRLGDVGSLASAIERLLEPDERRHLGGIGARRMKAEFSWEHLVRRRLAGYVARVGGAVT